MTKQIKDIDYKAIQLRDETWYKKAGVTFLFGKEIETIDNTHGSPNVILQDGLKIVQIYIEFLFLPPPPPFNKTQ